MFDDFWVQGGRLGVEESVEESPPRLEDGILAPEQDAALVRDELLPPCLSPAEAR